MAAPKLSAEATDGSGEAAVAVPPGSASGPTITLTINTIAGESITEEAPSYWPISWLLARVASRRKEDKATYQLFSGTKAVPPDLTITELEPEARAALTLLKLAAPRVARIPANELWEAVAFMVTAYAAFAPMDQFHQFAENPTATIELWLEKCAPHIVGEVVGSDAWQRKDDAQSALIYVRAPAGAIVARELLLRSGYGYANLFVEPVRQPWYPQNCRIILHKHGGESRQLYLSRARLLRAALGADGIGVQDGDEERKLAMCFLHGKPRRLSDALAFLEADPNAWLPRRPVPPVLVELCAGQDLNLHCGVGSEMHP